jgi:hypothetical protein
MFFFNILILDFCFTLLLHLLAVFVYSYGTFKYTVIVQVDLKVKRGNLVDEVHQQFNSWIYQVSTLS